MLWVAGSPLGEQSEPRCDWEGRELAVLWYIGSVGCDKMPRGRYVLKATSTTTRPWQDRGGYSRIVADVREAVRSLQEIGRHLGS